MSEPEIVEAEVQNEPAPAENKEALAVKAYEMPTRADMWAGGQSFADAMRMAKVLSMAPMVPQSYQNQPGNCLIAIDMAQRMNMPPMMIMQNLYIVNGNPGWSGQACIALINASGRFTPLKFKEEHNGDDFSCTAYATEIATGEVVYGTTVDKKMAKECGWLDKSGSYWKKMPIQMARYRSAAFFARTYCPQALMGLYTEDELYDIKGYPKEDGK
ncbi:MAG: recombinase RecT [Bacteroidales bacterium]|nr:recombinase RecT [Bacteroidales bacterium]